MKPPQRRQKPTRNPTQERARATVDAILEAAARIIEREGVAHLKTNQIAREAGVSIGSLYEYFSGRDPIVRALCDRHLDGVRQIIDAAFEQLADAPLDDAVGLVIDSLFLLHQGRPSLHQKLQHEFSLRFGLEPFIESDRYTEQKLVAWLHRRFPQKNLDDLSTRAFLAIRSGRTVTIHAFAEALPPDRLARVRAALKALLVSALSSPSLDPPEI